MTILDEFLAAHPEHIPGAATMQTSNGLEPCLDSAALRAFMIWAVKTRRAKRSRVLRGWRDLQAAFPDLYPGDLPV